jgi:hypothetical protein
VNALHIGAQLLKLLFLIDLVQLISAIEGLGDRYGDQTA